MDLGKVSKGDQIFTGAALVYFVASLLPWYGAPSEFVVLGYHETYNAWGDLGWLWGSMWAILLLAGAVSMVLPAFGVTAAKLPEVVYLAVSGLATLFTLLKLLIGEEYPISARFGIYLAVVAAGATLFGAFTSFKESGAGLGHHADAPGAPAPPLPPPPPPSAR